MRKKGRRGREKKEEKWEKEEKNEKKMRKNVTEWRKYFNKQALLWYSFQLL